MLSAIHKRLSYANVAVTLALVFAMSGGAYAANKYLITSTKQISPKVLKALKGKSGANGTNGGNGANGSAGAQGSQGPQGPAGANGSNGSNGQSVTGAAASKAECETGGVKYTSASGNTAVCNGKNGTTGFTETLPSGKSETGQWAFAQHLAGEHFEFVKVGLSFSIPLAEALDSEHGYVIGPEEGEGEPKENTVAIPLHCKGTVAKPEAVSGNLCVFSRGATHLKGIEIKSFEVTFHLENPEVAGPPPEGAGKSGAVVTALLNTPEEGVIAGNGDWVVTG